MVGGLDKIIYLPSKLAEQLGYFKEQNLDVELIDEPAGIEAAVSLVAGQVDAASGFVRPHHRHRRARQVSYQCRPTRVGAGFRGHGQHQES